MRDHFLILTVLLAWLPVWNAPTYAEAPSKEYLVKAAFIYNFTQFVEWPSDRLPAADAPFVVGIAGTDPFAGALEQAFDGKLVADRKVLIKHFDSVAAAQSCQVLIIANSEEKAMTAELQKKLSASAVLTVGENESFRVMGGAIRFYVDNNKIRFEVNLDTVEQSRLKMSSKLLKLARIVRK